MNLPSKLIENAVNEVAKLPGIGKKSALRLVMYLLKQDVSFTEGLSNALTTLRKEIKYCTKCFNIADEELCNICLSKNRDTKTICVVETFKELIAIENTAQYRGLYHVLGGLISPMENISPEELHIESLINRVKSENIQEVILALATSMEGDTTAFYLTKKLKEYSVKVTTLARGLPIGGELEYADEITLGRSIQTRITYQ
ncbi:MAG: recombination mediator RecR [Raineya sp.]|jgi:recombination protein RecR|nr:recombination mediator RecR [Raineya sp.]